MTVDAASGRAATAGADKKIRVWNIADGKKLADYLHKAIEQSARRMGDRIVLIVRLHEHGIKRRD